MKLGISVLCIILGLAPTSLCWASDLSEQIIKVDGPPSITLSNVSGAIAIQAWDRQEVRIVANQRLDSSAILREQIGNRIHIAAKKKSVGYTIQAPTNTTIDLHSTSGNISITGIEGRVEATTVSGDIRIESARNHLLAKTVSGNVTLLDCQGPTNTLHTVNGNLTLRAISGEVEVKSVSGDVNLSKANTSLLEIVSTSGNIRYEGQLGKKGPYRIHTHSGNIQLALPATASFEVTAHSFSGDFTSDFPLSVQRENTSNRPQKTSVHALCGDGGAVLELKSFSGRITIKKQ